jgi:hypothetical protein
MQSVIVNAMTTVRKFSDNIIVFGQTLNTIIENNQEVQDEDNVKGRLIWQAS